ncbi:MAG TPA: bile acid:sodium symporter family protein [Polyangiales bacterium]|nr:bile acid:sodium symporter family protein [Polyangiales bacterium]
MDAIDQVRLSFNPATLTLLNALIGLIMFGVALDIRTDDFKRVVRDPRGPLIGLGAQFLLLPAMTFGLVSIIRPLPSIGLGMMMVAACPGGNFSNFLAHHAKANSALSVSMTAISTALAIVMTPLNLAFWGGLDTETAAILKEVSLDPFALLRTILLILGIPLAAGMLVAAKRPALALRLRRPMKIFSLGAFGLFIVGALAANWQHFLENVGYVAFAVALHNAAALGLGYGTSRALGCPRYDARAISIEVGIQNSALALVLIFGFFDGLGGMAIIAAWWGVWHLISGLTVASYWAARPASLDQESLS